MQKIETPKTITVDGKEYALTEFSENVQRLADIHTQWREEVVQERLKVAKTEAALRNLDAELTQLVLDEIKAKQPVAEAAPEA